MESGDLTNPTGHMPVQFLNADQTEVVRLETHEEEKQRKNVFLVNTYVPLALKAILIAPAIGGLAVSLPVVAAIGTGAYFLNKRIFENAYANTKLDGWREEIERYAQDTSFLKEYDVIARKAGFDQSPPILIKEDNPYALHMSYIGHDQHAIHIGTGMFQHFQQNELRAMISHEMTHARLKHTKGLINRLPANAVGTLMTAAIVTAGIAGALPLLPVVAGIGALAILQTTVYSIQSRAEERICDRGAALICGGGKDLVTSLRKYNDLLKQDQSPKASVFKKILNALPVKYRPAIQRTRDYIFRSHPLISKREESLERFQNKHPAFCESRRAQFSAAFNAVASALPPSNFTEEIKSRLKYNENKRPAL